MDRRGSGAEDRSQGEATGAGAFSSGRKRSPSGYCQAGSWGESPRLRQSCTIIPRIVNRFPLSFPCSDHPRKNYIEPRSSVRFCRARDRLFPPPSAHHGRFFSGPDTGNRPGPPIRVVDRLGSKCPLGCTWAIDLFELRKPDRESSALTLNLPGLSACYRFGSVPRQTNQPTKAIPITAAISGSNPTPATWTGRPSGT